MIDAADARPVLTQTLTSDSYLEERALEFLPVGSKLRFGRQNGCDGPADGDLAAFCFRRGTCAGQSTAQP
jgi:hypothetical protein